MEVSGMTGAYAQTMIQRATDAQNKALANLMSVVTKVELSHAKPLGNLSPQKVDVTV